MVHSLTMVNFLEEGLLFDYFYSFNYGTKFVKGALLYYCH